MPSSSHRTSPFSSSSSSHPNKPSLSTTPDDNHPTYELSPILPHQTSSSEDDKHEESAHLLPQSTSPAYFTPLESTRVLSKFDRKLLPFLSLLYTLSFLDRSNIGNARLAGLDQDLHLSSHQYEWLLRAFYITYIAFEWMTLLYRVVPPHIYISLCVAAWGVLASLQATATSFWFLLMIRGLLGVSEAAFGPGVPVYLSGFFRREELALRTGLFVAAAPLGASFAGGLAWVITWIGERGAISAWRVLFLVEGFPSVVVAVWAWDFVPDGPGVVRWLSRREREVAVMRLREEREEEEEEEEEGGKELEEKGGYRAQEKRGIDMREVWKTLRDPKCYLTALMFFSCNVAFASMPVFLPTIIHDMGYTALTAQALSAPPYLLAFFVVILTAYLSDRYQSRSSFIILHSLIATVGYATIALCGYFRYEGTTLRYLALFPACVGFFSAITIIITWTVNNQKSETGKGAGVAIMNVIGQVGPLVGTSVFPSEEGPWYVRGMGVCAGFMLLVGVLAGILRWYLSSQNRKNKDKTGRGEYEGVGTTKRRQTFEYML